MVFSRAELSQDKLSGVTCDGQSSTGQGMELSRDERFVTGRECQCPGWGTEF
jgi:hypothetical protein